MSDNEKRKLLPIITLSRKQLYKLQSQFQLNKISESIDTSKLQDKEVLQVDKDGRVKINPNHLDYKYWTNE